MQETDAKTFVCSGCGYFTIEFKSDYGVKGTFNLMNISIDNKELDDMSLDEFKKSAENNQKAYEFAKNEFIKLKNAAESTQGVLGPLKDQLEHIKGYIEQGECIINHKLIEEDKTLSQSELEKLEISIEEQLDAKYIPGSKEPVMINFPRGSISVKTLDYIKSRFSNWRIGVPELCGTLYPFMSLDEVSHE